MLLCMRIQWLWACMLRHGKSGACATPLLQPSLAGAVLALTFKRPLRHVKFKSGQRNGQRQAGPSYRRMHKSHTQVQSL